MKQFVSVISTVNNKTILLLLDTNTTDCSNTVCLFTTMHILTETEARLVDEFILKYLQNLNKSLNKPDNEFGPEHFYHIISFFPTYRQEELANIDDKSRFRTNIAYNKYMERFTDE